MDGRGQDREEWVARAVMLFAGDTVVAALRVMQEHGVRQLPVVDEERGTLLGEVTDEQLRRLWAIAPLASMAEILSGTPEGITGGRGARPPEVVETAPLVDFFGAPGRWLN